MKGIVVLLVILGMIWWIRRAGHQRTSSSMPHRQTGPSVPAAMQACAHCGVHAPEKDMVEGNKGMYCNREHQRLAESP